MKLFLFFLLVIFIFLSGNSSSQVENVPLTNSVYTFLKEMKVKGLISYIREDDPLLSRSEVKEFLDEIGTLTEELSSTEKKLLNKYEVEFSDDLSPKISTQLFNPQNNLFKDLDEMLTDKVKYLYAYQEPKNNIYFEWLGHFYHGQDFSKDKAINSNLYDIGFRIRGTAFGQLGYNLTVFKGGVSGNKSFAEIIEPKLLSNFKWIEDIENIGNYGFTTGYLKYHFSPMERMNVSIQLGREDLTLGYGYGSKMVLSGDNPTMDFIKFNFDYGILNFSSLHASTVGYFNNIRDERHTKYYAHNHLKLKFDDLFDIGIGETMIYSGRGIELGYLTPLAFYKFIEMEIQDRDNGSLYFDIQTKFVNNLELQATFFLDENILSNLGDMEKFTNKTAYQLGAFWYEAFTVQNLSLIAEYTKIRPYVYTHYDIKNNYTAFGINLGHRIGPNADEIMFRTNYNFNDWVRLNLEYRFVREGNNIISSDGTIIKNVGGDIAVSHGESPASDRAFFLDGERVNNSFFSTGIRIEPIRDFIFDLSYNFSYHNNLTKKISDNLSYALLKFTLEY